jgi:hypothetical protein
MNIRIGSIPVKSRVPFAAWALAGLIALLSTASSFVQSYAHRGQHEVLASATAKEAQHASLMW